jgi:hypothetical protein
MRLVTLKKVGRVILNPPRLAPTEFNRRVRDNAPYRQAAFSNI